MKLRFFNTLSRQLQDFQPIQPGYAKMYTCGPTVYNFAHIGNFRAYSFEDLLRRTLEYAGLKVTQVMNLTDVDDKTIRDGPAPRGFPTRHRRRPRHGLSTKRSRQQNPWHIHHF